MGFSRILLAIIIPRWSLIGNVAILGDSLQLNRGHIKIYNDRRLPNSGKSKVGNYPHQALRKVELPIHMKYLSIKHVDVTYEEFNPVSNSTGKVAFAGCNGEIWNITNMPEQVDKARFMKVRANTKFQGEAALNVVFNFDLANTANGVFSVDANMGAMDGKKLNMASKGMGLVMVDDLQIDTLYTHITGTNTSASGTVLFAYHDLKIAALKEDKYEKGKLKKRPLISFVANTFVIKKANPKKGESAKEEKVTAQRDIEKSFFSLIWQCLKEGAIQTVKR